MALFLVVSCALATATYYCLLLLTITYYCLLLRPSFLPFAANVRGSPSESASSARLPKQRCLRYPKAIKFSQCQHRSWDPSVLTDPSRNSAVSQRSKIICWQTISLTAAKRSRRVKKDSMQESKHDRPPHCWQTSYPLSHKAPTPQGGGGGDKAKPEDQPYNRQGVWIP